MSKVRTRFAPSPTGSPHIGHLRTCVYSYALAKHSDGDFVLRIEDTDRRRYLSETVEIIKKMIRDFGMDWDEYYIQSERAQTGLYKKAAEKLVSEGNAFYCQCEGRDAKHRGFSKVLRDPCRDKGLKEGAIKIKVPDDEIITYHDIVVDRDISWDSNTVFDATLLKSKKLGELPTYHLAAIFDDHDMDITHVLRGYDWMPSTPIHLLVYRYLGFDVPKIGHLTDIQTEGEGKLSKRKGSTSIQQLLDEGYLKEALLNFVMLLGWAPKDNREFFTLGEFVETFDTKGLQKVNPIFNKDKLDWFDGEYIRRLSVDKLNSKFQVRYSKFAKLDQKKQMAITTLVQERIKKLTDFEVMAGFFFEEKKADKKLFGSKFQEHLTRATDAIEGVSDWKLEKLNDALNKVIIKQNFKTGNFYMDLRIALTGSKFTPPINESIIILGKTETLKRIQFYL